MECDQTSKLQINNNNNDIIIVIGKNRNHIMELCYVLFVLSCGFSATSMEVVFSLLSDSLGFVLFLLLSSFAGESVLSVLSLVTVSAGFVGAAFIPHDVWCLSQSLC